MSLLFTIFAFLLAITILVAFHEWGHYWVARRCGVHVFRFSVGFGPRLWQVSNRQGTEFALSAIPLGGYVKLYEDPSEKAEVPPETALNAHPLWQRFAVVLAGPLANFVLAFLFFWVIFWGGEQGLAPIIEAVQTNSVAQQAGLLPGDEVLRINQEKTHTWQGALEQLVAHLGAEAPAQLTVKRSNGVTERLSLSLAPAAAHRGRKDFLNQLGIMPALPAFIEIQQVVPDSPAATAGLEVGDRLLAVQGKRGSVSELIEIIKAHPKQSLPLSIERAGRELVLPVTPTLSDNEGKIGVLLAGRFDESQFKHRDYTALQSAGVAAKKVVHYTGMTFTFIGRMLTGRLTVEHLSGPVTIAQGAAASARLGVKAYLHFLALISISLAVLNLLPIPVLDGGHVLFYLIEAIRGKALSVKAQMVGVKMGLVILLVLTSIALYNDFTFGIF